MPRREIYLIVGSERDSPVHRIAFKHRTSAEIYIVHRGIKADIRPIMIYDEFDDAINHSAEICRTEAMNKLTPDDRRALGIN